MPPAEVAALCRTSFGFLTAERAIGLEDVDPGEARRVVEEADGVLLGRVKFFGYPPVLLEEPIDYSYDPHAGVRWPSRHAKRIDYRHLAEADAKWIWELNRLQNLPLLAQAWLLSGDDRYADAALNRVERWAGQSAPGRGIAWSNGYEAGLRAISLAVTFDALRRFEGMDEGRAQRLLTVLWQHTRWIERDPSTHSSANNHRIGELVGLLVVSLLVPEVPGSESRRRRAIVELENELGRQILPDGTGAEQAFYYHLYVLDLTLLAVAALDVTGQSVPDGILDALRRSADAISTQVGEGEPAPRYGDEDDGRGIRLDTSERIGVQDVASSLAARLGHPGARRLAPSLRANTWWLFGESGRERFVATKPGEPPGSAILPDGGLVLLRRHRTRASIDIGPLGYLSLAAHGHADALAVTLAHRGRDLVTDPGTGSYFRRPDLRPAFRGTGFHATVLVDDEDQAESGGAFLWTRHTRVRLLHADLRDGVVVASHDGYERLVDPVHHRRAVVILGQDGILVWDQLDAIAEHKYSVRWPLHPDLRAEAIAKDLVSAHPESGPCLLLRFVASQPGKLRLTYASENPLEGWWSPRFESVVPAWLVSWDATCVGRLEVASLLVPEGAASPHPHLRLQTQEHASVVEIGKSKLRLEFSATPPIKRLT